ncbi:MAG TPA: LacI family DNA-binding transcriptional regulator [Elusimicrobiota bacterium]|nr:LacI family DNA-binding transcriptional regulator [Elusimicrobiota bacterium]
MSSQENKQSKSGLRRVTMKDVAEHCGVSLSTVSLVLSGDQRIPPDTTQRVLEVVKALGYRPNLIARNLAKQRSRTLGVVLPDLGAVVDHSFFTEALKGVYSETSRQGYRLLLEIATPQFLSRRFYLRLLKENSVDGIVYLGTTLKDDFLREIEPYQYPFLMVGGYLDDAQLSYVAVDNEAGAHMATKHLIDLGHRRIGHIAGSAAVSSARDRLRGYRRALEEAGIPFEPTLVVDGHYKADVAQEVCRGLLANKVTAVYAGSDWMASGAFRAIKEAGLRIPQDVSVIGSGDLDLARLVEPPLTTVKYDISMVAADGTRRIIQQIESGEPPAVFQEKYPVQLMVRQSSSPPKNV